MNRDKILVVEDEKNICNFMKMVFENNGYQIFFAENAMSGMTMYYSHHPDLVLLDVEMPEMNGIETLEAIRARQELAELPVLFLSASEDMEEAVANGEYEVQGFVKKPVLPMNLYERVEEVCK